VTRTTDVDLSSLFRPGPEWTLHRTVSAQGALREVRIGGGGEGLVLDRFAASEAACGFLRLRSDQLSKARVRAEGAYCLQSSAAGGWFLESEGLDDCYWVPQLGMLRAVSLAGHILKEEICSPSRLQVDGNSSFLEFEIPSGLSLDVIVWQIPSREKHLTAELSRLARIETQAIFLWGSHTTYRLPGDLYLHLIFGYVYENRYAWPYNRKICSENDAHALYVALSGLQRATSKKLYGLLKAQLLLSVLSRQFEDGGWHHGEWSEDMEAHIRLNGSAIHLLLDSLNERDDGAVRRALENAVEFVSRHKDQTEFGAWFLHDSLELNVDGMKKSPFKWLPSRALGKSQSNMLVLNTHLDCLVLLDRYRQVTGDARYNDLVISAQGATRAVLGLRPLEVIYRVIFSLIRWNLLPTQAQRALPLPQRALKRLARKWLKSNLVQLTGRYPRFVMPGGYIERAIALRGVVDDYHSINVMDLLRYWRRFPKENLDPLITDAVEFIQKNHVDTYWGESPVKKYALGFWAEALYHLYSLTPDVKTLSYLAEIMIKLEILGIGLPPSLLGANAEAVAQKDQIGCPSATDNHLRVANLSGKGRTEFLVVNPTTVARRLTWEPAVPSSLSWKNNGGDQIDAGDDIQLPALGWVVGRGDEKNRSQILLKQKECADQGVLSL
jgi:hypothetical protein